jgi:hypothetical protein
VKQKRVNKRLKYSRENWSHSLPPARVARGLLFAVIHGQHGPRRQASVEGLGAFAAVVENTALQSGGLEEL